MKNKLTSVIMILLLAAFIKASAEDNIGASSSGEFEKVGATGGQFLKIGVGARSAGMGGAYAAVSNDLSSIHWNPAGIAELGGLSAEFDHTFWFGGFSHDFAAIALPLGENFRIAAHLLSFGVSDIPITTIEQPEGTGASYSVSDLAVGVSFGGYLTEQFSFGVTAKLVNQSFSTLSSSGIAFDVGTKYETGIRGIKLAFSMHNLGTKLTYEGTDLKTSIPIDNAAYSSRLDAGFDAYPYALPLVFRAGIASDVIDMEEHKLVAAFDFLTLSDTPEQFALGAEYTWNNLLSVRAGYLIGQDQLGFSGGVGVKYVSDSFNGNINYSISPTSSLGLVNRLSVQLDLGQ